MTEGVTISEKSQNILLHRWSVHWSKKTSVSVRIQYALYSYTIWQKEKKGMIKPEVMKVEHKLAQQSKQAKISGVQKKWPLC